MDEEQERSTKMKGRTYFYSSTDDDAFFGGTDTIKEAFEQFKKDRTMEGLEECCIGYSDRPFKIDGSVIDSKYIIEDMEETANVTEKGFFDWDGYDLKQEEYDELSEIIAKEIAKYLHKKFSTVEEDGTDRTHTCVKIGAWFNKDGVCESVENKEIGIQPGWKVGDKEP